MRRYHQMILRMLPGPMVASLALLMFLLVMQFLIKFLPDLVGKGLPFFVIVELISYNLAYMLVLAVPMSVLITAVMTFGRLVDTQAYTVMKTSGVSYAQLAWPALLVGLMLTGAMWYFNNDVLPEANYRAYNLWRDIRVTKPGFGLTEGQFYDDIDQYRILVQDIPEDRPNELNNITIYDYTEGSRFRTDITAKHGVLDADGTGDALNVTLFDGEIHRRKPPGSNDENRYEYISFSRHRLRIPLDNLTFERSDPGQRRRTDRSIRTRIMVHMVDSLDQNVRAEREKMRSMFTGLGRGNLLPGLVDLPTRERSSSRIVQTVPAAGTSVTSRRFDRALIEARSTRSGIDSARRSVEWSQRKANRYRVEIHKKRSIALACFIFMLIGAPIGLSVRRGGLGMAAALAVVIFLFYWVTLVNGEKLADRGLLPPWIGMWAGNIVTGIAGLIMSIYVAYDWRAVRPPWRRSLRQKVL